MVSHCNTVGKREEYVAELVDTTPVDIFGKCNERPIPKTTRHKVNLMCKISKLLLEVQKVLTRFYF